MSANPTHMVGFAGTFHTLWAVSAQVRGEYRHITYTYLRNLPTERSAALASAAAVAGAEVGFDGSLCGTQTETRSVPIDRHPATQLTFGKCAGHEIATCVSAWHLWETYRGDRYGNAERVANCAARLVELGEGVWVGGELVATAEAERATWLHGHYHSEGEKVSVAAVLRERFSYDTAYGTTYVLVFVTAERNVYRYMGGSPPHLTVKGNYTPLEVGQALRLTGVVKHGTYNGTPYTQLQRIKLS